MTLTRILVNLPNRIVRLWHKDPLWLVPLLGAILSVLLAGYWYMTIGLLTEYILLFSLYSSLAIIFIGFILLLLIHTFKIINHKVEKNLIRMMMVCLFSALWDLVGLMTVMFVLIFGH